MRDVALGRLECLGELSVGGRILIAGEANPRPTACHHRLRPRPSPGASSTRPCSARCRRCQLVTDGLAPTCGASPVAVSGPCSRSRSRIVSRTGWARARIPLASSSTSPSHWPCRPLERVLSIGLSQRGVAWSSAMRRERPQFGMLVRAHRGKVGRLLRPYGVDRTRPVRTRPVPARLIPARGTLSVSRKTKFSTRPTTRRPRRGPDAVADRFGTTRCPSMGST